MNAPRLTLPCQNVSVHDLIRLYVCQRTHHQPTRDSSEWLTYVVNSVSYAHNRSGRRRAPTRCDISGITPHPAAGARFAFADPRVLSREAFGAWTRCAQE